MKAQLLDITWSGRQDLNLRHHAPKAPCPPQIDRNTNDFTRAYCGICALFRSFSVKGTHLGYALILLLLSSPALAGEWTKADTYREVTYLALHVADWGQTLEIADHPEKWHEYNPVLGSHPSRGDVNAYFIATGLLHPVISYGLRKYAPDGWVQAWQYVTIGIEIGAVANNASIGIGFGF